MPAVAKKLSEFFGQSYDGFFTDKVIFDAIFDAKDKNGKPKIICKRIGACTNKEISTYTKDGKYYMENRYMTANGFFADWRQEKYLFALHNLVVDVDAHSAPFEEINDLVEDFLHFFYRDLVNFRELPAPSLVNKTGRGVQLWFSLEQCSSKLIFIYKRVAKAFVSRIQDLLDEYPDELKHLEVDRGASGNPAGLYRIPGSYNVITKTFGSYEIYGYKYSLVELDKEFVREFDIIPSNYREATLKNSAPEFHGKDLPKGKYTLTQMRRMDLVEGLIVDRCKEIGSETRNLLMLIYYNAAVQVMGRADARQKLIKLNCSFKEPLDGYDHIINYIDTVHNYYGEDGYLPIKNSTLIEKLSLTMEEQVKYKINSRRNGQKPVPNEARDRNRRIRKADRDKMIYALAEKGMTVQAIAGEVGCHRNTVSKVLDFTGKTAARRTELAHQVRKLKKQRGMTYKKIAEKLGISIDVAKKSAKY